MPDSTISALPAAGALGGTEPTPLVQGGVTSRSTPAAFGVYIQGVLGLTLNNPNSAVDPTVNSDSSLGYSAGSMWFNTTKMAVWICRVATVGAAVWDRISFATFSSFVSGRYYAAMPGTVGIAPGGVISDGTVFFQPFVVRERVTISELGANVDNVGAGGKFQMGVHANDPATCRPTGLPLGTTQPGAANGLSTSVSTGVTGASYVAGAPSNFVLEPGPLYWQGTQGNATAQAGGARFLNQYTQENQAFLAGGATSTQALPNDFNLSAAQTTGCTYGTWPDLTAAVWVQGGNRGALLILRVA